MSGPREKLREDAHFRILRLLKNNPEITQRELAREMGISTGGIHYALNALVEKGLVKFANFSSAQDKRRYAYVLTPSGILEKAALTRRFLERKMAEYEALRHEIETVRAMLDDTELTPSPSPKE